MKAVVFDLDDTLYPRVRYVHSGFSAIARHLSERFALDPQDVYGALRRMSDAGFGGRELQQVCAVYGLDIALVPELVSVLRQHEPELWLSHDVIDMLAAFRRRGWGTAILTNGLPSVQFAKVRALGLDTLVDHVVYADEYADGGKPASEPFLEVLRRLQTASHDAVMVGDNRINDIEGARASGMRTILLARGGRPGHGRGGDVIVDRLSDVPQIAFDLIAGGVAHAA